MGVLDTLAAATDQAPREFPVKVITDAKLYDEWQAATNALDAAVDTDAKHASMAGRPATTAAVEKLEAIRDKVMASEVEFVFAKIGWTNHVGLQAEHPPVKGNPIHARRGYNVETFTNALIRRSCIRVVGADGDVSTTIPAATWDGLLGAPARPSWGDQPARPAIDGTLNMGAVNDLYRAATEANEGTVQVPPSARSLLGSQDSGASLAQPSPGTPAPDASEAGSPRTSPTSSDTPTDTPTPDKSPAT